MAPRAANVGKKRADTDEPSKPSRPSRAKKVDTTTTATASKPKHGASAAPEKNAKNVKTTNASKPTAAKRRAEDEADSKPSKRARSTKDTTSTPSTTTKTTKAAAAKPKPVIKKTAAAKPKTTSKTTETKPAKGLSAKKSPVETRKVEPEINAVPTERLRIFACGEGTAGELGLGPKGTQVKRPRYNALLDPETVGIVQMSAGGMHVLALTHDSKILTWGVNDQGALGRDTSWEGGLREIEGSGSDSEADSETADLNPVESTPTPVDPIHFPEGTKFVQAAAGDSCSFVLTTTGHVYGWGTFRVSR
jgi:regulator of chromosome condensation